MTLVHLALAPHRARMVRTHATICAMAAPTQPAGFITYAHLRGVSDRAIAHQIRHRPVATVGTYVRIEEAWADNAATQLGL